MDVKMSTEELQAFLGEQFEQVAQDFVVEQVAPMQITVRKLVQNKHLRPGGTVSGPTMFALADVSIYLAILA